MECFGYCIWALPEYNTECYNYTDGFYPHISIKKYLSLDEAYLYFQNMYFEPTDIYISDLLVPFNTSVNFCGLYYDVYTNNIPSWWPENAHMSLNYRYDNPYTKNEIEFFSTKIQNKKITINKFMIVRCDGHFKNWKNQILDIR